MLPWLLPLLGLDPELIEQDGAAPAPAMAPGAPVVVALQDDPYYAPFFKMKRDLEALHVIKSKMEAAGLDPELIEKDGTAPAPVLAPAPESPLAAKAAAGGETRAQTPQEKAQEKQRRAMLTYGKQVRCDCWLLSLHLLHAAPPPPPEASTYVCCPPAPQPRHISIYVMPLPPLPPSHATSVHPSHL